MKDKSQHDLESLYERCIMTEAIQGAGVARNLASKSVEHVINVIVGIIDLDSEVPQALIDRVVDEQKIGQLISAIQDKGLTVPAEVAHAIETSGVDEFEDGEGEGLGFGDEEIPFEPASDDRIGKEADFDNPDFSGVEDEEVDPDEGKPSFKVNPAM